MRSAGFLQRTGAVFLALAVIATPALSETVDRSTEYVSPFGDYQDVTVTRTLTTGIPSTSAGTPANAAESDVIVEGVMTKHDGNSPDDSNFRLNLTQTFITDLQRRDNPAIEIEGRLNVATGQLLVAPYEAKTAFWVSIGVPPVDSPPNYNNQDVRAELDVRGEVWSHRFHVANEFAELDRHLVLGLATGDSTFEPTDPNWQNLPIWGEMGARNVVSNADTWQVLRLRGKPGVFLNARTNPPQTGLVSNGNVGIGTRTPTSKLQVGESGGSTKAIAWAWGQPSSREFKKDIAPLSPADYHAVTAGLAELDVVRYRYKSDPSHREHLGIIAEKAPADLVTAERNAMSLGDSIGYLLAVMRELKKKNDALESHINRLEREIALLEKRGRK